VGVWEPRGACSGSFADKHIRAKKIRLLCYSQSKQIFPLSIYLFHMGGWIFYSQGCLLERGERGERV
jgi:hypothetical protein